MPLVTKIIEYRGRRYHETTTPCQQLLHKEVRKIYNTKLSPGFKVQFPAQEWIERKILGTIPVEYPPNDEITVNPYFFFNLPKKLTCQLRPLQDRILRQAAESMFNKGSYKRGWISPLGSGKTLVGLCALHDESDSVVLAPLYLHGPWREQAKIWGLREPHLCTYESAHKLPPKKRVILDEVLAVKNPEAQRTRATAKLCKKAQLVIGYTGTPSSTKPMDLRWVNAVSEGAMPTAEYPWMALWGINPHLDEPTPGVKAWAVDGWHLDKISEFIEPRLGIVDIKEILDELPDVEYQRIRIPTYTQYDNIVAGMYTMGTSQKILAQTRQGSDGWIYRDDETVTFFSRNKINALRAITDATDEPVVVFAGFQASVQLLAKEFEDENPAVLHGGGSDYGPEIARFTSGKTRLIICSSSISSGMNLQRARIMVFFSNALNPQARLQAIGRIVRPGQKAEGVQIYDLLMDGTLDERQLELLTGHMGESEAFIKEHLMRSLESLRMKNEKEGNDVRLS